MFAHHQVSSGSWRSPKRPLNHAKRLWSGLARPGRVGDTRGPASCWSRSDRPALPPSGPLPPGSLRAASRDPYAGQSGPEHDLAERVAPLELSVGVPYLAQRIDLGDRNLEPAFADERDELDEDFRTRRGGGPFRLDPVGFCRLPVRDGVDAIGFHPELDGQFDIAGTEGVDEGVDRSVRGCPNAVRHALAVGHGQHAVAGEPGMMVLAGQ